MTQFGADGLAVGVPWGMVQGVARGSLEGRPETRRRRGHRGGLGAPGSNLYSFEPAGWWHQTPECLSCFFVICRFLNLFKVLIILTREERLFD